jgi:hypothetical protein
MTYLPFHALTCISQSQIPDGPGRVRTGQDRSRRCRIGGALMQVRAPRVASDHNGVTEIACNTSHRSGGFCPPGGTGRCGFGTVIL